MVYLVFVYHIDSKNEKLESLQAKPYDATPIKERATVDSSFSGSLKIEAA